MSSSVREKVFQAADALFSEHGRSPSIRQILEKTGGSSTTVQKYLKAWQEEQARRAQRPGFPLQVQRVLGEAWDELVTAAKSAFDEERRHYEARISEFEGQITTLQGELETLQTAVAHRDEQLAALHSAAESEAQRRRESELVADGLREQLALTRQASETAGARLEELRVTQQAALDGVKAAHGQEIARLQEMFERAENHLLRELDEARRQRGCERSAHEAEIAAIRERAESKQAELQRRGEQSAAELRKTQVSLSRAEAAREHLAEKCAFLEEQLRERARLLKEERTRVQNSAGSERLPKGQPDSAPAPEEEAGNQSASPAPPSVADENAHRGR